jgi:hypothetical protein
MLLTGKDQAKLKSLVPFFKIFAGGGGKAAKNGLRNLANFVGPCTVLLFTGEFTASKCFQ